MLEITPYDSVLVGIPLNLTVNILDIDDAPILGVPSTWTIPEDLSVGDVIVQVRNSNN